MLGRTISWRQLAVVASAFVVIQAIGIVGFVLINDEAVVDAYYRTVVLVSTVGLDSLPAGPGAKLFSVFVIALGVALFLLVATLVIELAVGGVVSGRFQTRRLRRAVDRLEGHYVICGYGRVGRRVAEEFRNAGAAHVVIERDPAIASSAREHGVVTIEGSATDDETLNEAGVARARGLVACLDSDAENLFAVVSARELNPGLLIVAGASTDDAGTKLQRGGADRAVTPYGLAGRELATIMLKPEVSAFLEIVTATGEAEFRFEQIDVGTAQAGRTIRELRVRERTGALVIAHKRPGESFNTRPDPDAKLGVDDVLIGVGTVEELRALEDLFGRPEVIAQ